MKLTDYFEPYTPSAEAAPTRSAAKIAIHDMWWYAAPIGIMTCLDQDRTEHTFSTREIFDAVPEINEIYQTPKTLGDRLGRGVAGHGLGLHRDNGGKFFKCRENATLFLMGACCPDYLSARERVTVGATPDEVMTDVDFDLDLLDQLTHAVGCEDVESLVMAIHGLPSIRDMIPTETIATPPPLECDNAITTIRDRDPPDSPGTHP